MTNPDRAKPSRSHSRCDTAFRSRAMLMLTCALASPLSAHEFWLRPETFQASVGEPIAVRVFVGDGFEMGEPYARNPRHIRYFRVEPEEAGELAGEAGDEPAGVFTAKVPGLSTLVYRSYTSRVSLDAEKFESYLKDEGLESIIDRRAELGESDKPGTEAFSRCAKSLIEVAGGAAKGHDRLLGLALEVVPLAPPLALGDGKELPIQVLWGGEPLAGAQVRVFFEGEPERTFTVRTGTDGSASLGVGGSGVRLISVVHMERADPGSAVDWESTWSSLTFEIRE